MMLADAPLFSTPLHIYVVFLNSRLSDTFCHDGHRPHTHTHTLTHLNLVYTAVWDVCVCVCCWHCFCDPSWNRGKRRTVISLLKILNLHNSRGREVGESKNFTSLINQIWNQHLPSKWLIHPLDNLPSMTLSLHFTPSCPCVLRV